MATDKTGDGRWMQCMKKYACPGWEETFGFLHFVVVPIALTASILAYFTTIQDVPFGLIAALVFFSYFLAWIKTSTMLMRAARRHELADPAAATADGESIQEEGKPTTTQAPEESAHHLGSYESLSAWLFSGLIYVIPMSMLIFLLEYVMGSTLGVNGGGTQAASTTTAEIFSALSYYNDHRSDNGASIQTSPYIVDVYTWLLWSCTPTILLPARFILMLVYKPSYATKV